MERLCLYCHEAISGRIDKKFCSDQCRNAYNNEKNAGKENHLRRINAILRKNRQSLENLCGSLNKKVVPESALTQLGFNYNYFTSQYTTKNGHVYFFCYEYGYLKIEHGKVVLVKRNSLDY